MILILKLILSHLISDFILQPKTWVAAKAKKSYLSYELYLHILVHFVITMLLVWDWNFLWWCEQV